MFTALMPKGIHAYYALCVYPGIFHGYKTTQIPINCIFPCVACSTAGSHVFQDDKNHTNPIPLTRRGGAA